MRHLKSWSIGGVIAGLAIAGAVALSAPALAQVGPNGAINPQRDCQTLLACQFQKGGSYRGCISAYSCRVCKLTPTRCTISGRERVCQEMQCRWGS